MLNDSIKIGRHNIQNRMVFQPMEGFDCLEDGAPGELTVRKYLRFASSGAGIIWFEANAVCGEGRTNLRQMHLTEDNSDIFKRLVDEVKSKALKESGFEPTLILQLTHSGRQSCKPLTMYYNNTYEKVGRSGELATDTYLDSLPELFASSTKLAKKVGFDGVDVKACHGYLLIEALSAFTREGKYGGSFENRMRLFLDCIDAAASETTGGMILSSRLGVSDMVAKPDGFGTDEDGNPDMTEPLKLIKLMKASGIELLNITVGNPYYNPHINRPFKVGGYVPPEPPEKGLERFITLTKQVKDQNPDLLVVSSGLTYYHKNSIIAAQKMLDDKICDFVGFGRMILAYPEFYNDYLSGNMQTKKLCVMCSKCSALMRAKQSSGCAIHDEIYKQIYKENLT